LQVLYFAFDISITVDDKASLGCDGRTKAYGARAARAASGPSAGMPAGP
jgi:hypothetical protein